MTPDPQGFGRRLRWWREHRGRSQLDLSLAAGSSQRHVSFLESGRTAPSRDMVLRLAAALDVPLRQQNVLLLAAGFSPAWAERDWSAPDLEKVNRALDRLLGQQEPYPAVVVDRRWNLLRANQGAVRLTEFLAGPPAAGGAPSPPPEDPPRAVNLAEALVSPQGMRPRLVNWEEVALYFLRGVQADAVADGTVETQELVKRLHAFPGVAELLQRPPPEQAAAPVLTMHFRNNGMDLRLFTAIATLGTPHDVMLQELRVEFFFPADESTAQQFRAWADK